MKTNNKERNEIEVINKLKFEKIRSNYFLELLFNNLEKKKKLTLLKYNKNIKKRINININNYKEYSEKYSSIEIIIIPVKYKYGFFINIKKEDEKYFHIYFNNEKEEIKRNYITGYKEIKKIKIIIDYVVKSFKGLFEGIECVESIYFKRFYRNNINDMSYMFFSCHSLKELNLNNFNTSNVTDMSYMFCDCSSLKELNLNNFKTSNVTDMRDMFSGCSSLKKLNLNNFNTNNVSNMKGMFWGCSSLKALNLNNFNTNKVANKSFMFSECSNELVMKIKSLIK